MIIILLLPGHNDQLAAQTITDTVRSNAINDTIVPPAKLKPANDTVSTLIRRGKFEPKPKKAGLYSAIIPGLGQVYNRNYWKVPVIYLGIGVAAYYYNKNYSDYQSYRQEYIARISNSKAVNEKYKNLDETQILQKQSDAKKYLDMTVLFSGIGYALQVIDAVTSAHLKNFDISRDISMRAFPTVVPGGVGVTVVVNMN